MRRVLSPNTARLIAVAALIICGAAAGRAQTKRGTGSAAQSKGAAASPAQSQRAAMELLDTKISATQTTIDIVGQVKKTYL